MNGKTRAVIWHLCGIRAGKLDTLYLPLKTTGCRCWALLFLGLKRKWGNMLYLEPVLLLHQTAVEKGGSQVWRNTQDFGDALGCPCWNTVTCPQQDISCVHHPRGLSSKGLFFTQVESGCNCACRVIYYFQRDAQCFPCGRLRETYHICSKIKQTVYSQRKVFTLFDSHFFRGNIDC